MTMMFEHNIKYLLTRCIKETCRSSSIKNYSRFVEGKLPLDAKLNPPWKILFFGTDDYSLAHLQALNNNRISSEKKAVESLEVVVPKSKSLVRKFASEHELQIHQWPIPTMENKYDVGVIVSFGQLIPKRIIQMFPYGILNVHPSLLPRWRGASPINHTILSGDTVTGISIMEIRPEHFDIGPLLAQQEFPVPENFTAFQLRDHLAVKGQELLLQTLYDLPRMEGLEHEQSGEGVTYAHKLSHVNAKLNWTDQTRDDIYRQYKAVSEMFPLRTFWKDHSVKLIEMLSPREINEDAIHRDLEQNGSHNLYPPGMPYYCKRGDYIGVKCKDGWAGFRKVVIKKTMSAQAFYNGYLSKPENSGVCFTSADNELDSLTLKKHASQIR